MAAILQTKFALMKIVAFGFKFHWKLFPTVQNASTGSNNGLAPNRRQAIIWTHDGVV